MKQIEKYELVQRVAVGGMADVFLARVMRGENVGAVVALKCLRPEVSDESHFASMFKDEARLAVLLDHPFIVKTLEESTANAPYFMAMEYIAGSDLMTFLRRVQNSGGQLSKSFCLSILSMISKGLAYAHHLKDRDGTALNLVHRDISPQNILLTFDGRVKVIDFGIAKRVNRESESQAGALKGKYGYMSPEQVLGGHITQSSDIFSLGVVAFELFTQQKLFQGGSDFSVLQKIRYAQIPNLPESFPSLEPSIERFLVQALKLEPAERFDSMDAMGLAIDGLIQEFGSASSDEISCHAKKYLKVEFEENQRWVEQGKNILEQGDSCSNTSRNRGRRNLTNLDYSNGVQEDIELRSDSWEDLLPNNASEGDTLDCIPTQPLMAVVKKRRHAVEQAAFAPKYSARKGIAPAKLILSAFCCAALMLWGMWKVVDDSGWLEREKTGLVVLTEPPKAKLFLNGIELGRTPFSSSTIKPGTHKLVLTHLGYQDLHQVIQVDTNGILELELLLRPTTSQ